MADLSQPHDAFFKAVIKDPENLKTILAEFLPEEILKYLNLDKLQILPEERISLSKEKRLIPDLVAEAPFLDRRLQIYILLEHKSQPELRAYLQAGYYILSLHEEDLRAGRKLTPVLPLIYYHGKTYWNLPHRFIDLFELPEELQPYFLDFTLEVIDLTKVDDKELLEKLELYGFLYAFLWLQKNIWKASLEDIAYVFERLVSLGSLMSERGRILFGFMVKYVAGVKGVDEKEVVIKIIQKGGDKVEMEIRTFWDDIRDEARKEGLEQGLQEGLQQGLILSTQETIIEALEVKFGLVPERVVNTIKSLQDLSTLKKLFRAAITLSNLSEFEKELDRELNYT